MVEYQQSMIIDRKDIILSDIQEKELNKWINERKTAIETDREEFFRRYKRFLFNYDDFISFEKNGKLENQLNLHMPLTAIMFFTFFSRLYNIFSDPNTVQLSPRGGIEDEDLVEMVKKLRRWYLFDYINEYEGIRSFLAEVLMDTCGTGYGIGMKDWFSKQRKQLVLQRLDKRELKKELQDLDPQIAEANRGDGANRDIEDVRDRSKNIKQYKEVEKIIKVYEGTRLRSIPFENAFFPNEIPGVNNLDHPELVIIETEMSLSEIMLRAKAGEWSQDIADRVEQKGLDEFTGKMSQEIKDQRYTMSGIKTKSVDAITKNRIVEYVFCSYDIDQDGINEELMIMRSGDVIMKPNYLDRISRTGHRPLLKFDCFFKPRQAYSRGVPELMFTLNEEMDMHHNMRLEYMGLQACPWGVYRAGGSLKDQDIRVEPGLFIPVEDISDMKVMNFTSSAVPLATEEDRNWRYAEQLAAVSPLSAGSVPETVGPTRSTSGVLALLRQMDKRFKPVVDLNAGTIKKMEKMILFDDLDWRIDDEPKLRVLGSNLKNVGEIKDRELRSVIHSAMMIGSSFDIRIDVAKVIESDEVRRNDAGVILQQIITPGLAHQLGIIGPKGIFRAYKNYLIAWDQNHEDYLSEPKFVEEALTLFQEIQLCGQGQIPPMALTDNHEEKAQGLLQFMQTPVFIDSVSKGIFVKNVASVIQRAANKHLAIAQALQPKGIPGEQGQANDVGAAQAGRAPQQTQEGENAREIPAAAGAASPSAAAPEAAPAETETINV